jgi:hypothetical protein
MLERARGSSSTTRARILAGAAAELIGLYGTESPNFDALLAILDFQLAGFAIERAQT